ncbi:MAG TPA: hypothetical protein VKT82_29010 [Ktedonobacterales bacterium]|nr:hypothetical protein [Ktedonobacterales bacterium]
MQDSTEARLARLEQQLLRLETRLNYVISAVGIPADRAEQAVDTELRRQAPAYDLIGEVKALLRAKRKVEAMQLYGERTGSDFKTTQKAIEALEKQL